MNSVYASLGTTIFETMSRLAAERGAVNLGQGFPEDDGPRDILEAAARASGQELLMFPSTLSDATLGGFIAGGFGGIGSSREMMIASLAEPAMLMVVFTLSLLAGSTQLSSIAAAMQGPGIGLRVSLALALVGLLMVAIAENARIPVDNPATHLELTMVHEAMVLEYSGRHLAVLEFAAALKLLLYLSLIACIFVPWGLAPPGGGLAAYAVGLATYLGKLAVGGFLLVLLETSIAKMRVFRVPDFLGVALMLGLLGTLLLFVSRSF